MVKKLAIIGAGYLQLPAYHKAKDLGIKTIGFAWDEGAVAKDYCTRFYPVSTLDKEEILKKCISEDVDGVITLATDIAVPTVSFVAEQMGLTGNSTHSALISTNKYLMRKAFSRNGLNVPEYFQINSIQELDVYRERLSKPLIIKPVDRSGSRGVNKVSNFNRLREAAETALNESLCGQAIIEQFIKGVEISVEAISFNGKHYGLAVTDKVTTGSPHFVELEHHQPSGLSGEVQEFLYSETFKALDALNIRFGASHSEFIVSEESIYITEVGARMGGDFIGSELVYLSTGYDFLKGLIDVSLNQFEEPVRKRKKHAGVFFYSSESIKVGRIIREKLFSDKIIKSEIFSDELKPLHQSSDRMGYFIYESDKRPDIDKIRNV